MTHWVITTGDGLTRRLIEADDVDEARERYLVTLRGGDKNFSRKFSPQPGEIHIRMATDADLAEFELRRRRRLSASPGDNQLAWDV